MDTYFDPTPGRVYSTALNLLLNREDIREIRRWGNSVAFMNDEQTPLTELKVSMFGMDQIERLATFLGLPMHDVRTDAATQVVPHSATIPLATGSSRFARRARAAAVILAGYFLTSACVPTLVVWHGQAPAAAVAGTFVYSVAMGLAGGSLL